MSGGEQTVRFVESRRKAIEASPDAFLSVAKSNADSMSWMTDECGCVCGGRMWINDPAAPYCVTETHVYSVWQDRIVASCLFTEATQEAITDFLATQFHSRKRANEKSN